MEHQDNRKRGTAAKSQLAAAMLIFGSIGLFRRSIPLESSLLATLRGLIGAAFLLVLTRLRGQRVDLGAIRRHLGLLLLSGGVLGVNWILLFEAYRYTSVATATLCYYMAPVIVLLLSPVLLKEPLTARKGGCILAALAGMVLVSGAGQTGTDAAGSAENWMGILLGLSAAAFYAGVILLNKRLQGLTAADRTIVQLGASAVLLLPYAALTGGFTGTEWTGAVIALVAVVGVLHTGVAYALYFGAMKALPAQTVALYSYIDPAAAVLFSALVLREPMTAAEWLGAALVLAATLLSELPGRTEDTQVSG